DPIWNKPLGGHPFLIAGLEADAFVRKTRTSVKALAAVLAKNRTNALRNPLAAYAAKVDAEQVLSSAERFAPLRALDIAAPGDGDRLRRGRRPVLLQRAAAPGGGGAGEEGGSRPHGPQGRLRSRWGVARQRGRRVARMRERLRGDWPASGRRGRPPTPGRRRKPSDRRRARRRRAILAVHSVRDGGGRGPGGRPMRK